MRGPQQEEKRLGTVVFDIANTKKSVFSALLEARQKHGGDRVAMIDGDDRQLSYDEIVRAAFALGHALKRRTKPGEKVGVLLPTGGGAVIAFFALLAYGRVPAMLNFTGGSRNIKAACKAAEVTKVVTANRFIEIGKLDALIEDLSDGLEIIKLEEVREGLSLRDKVAGGLGPVVPALFKANTDYRAPAVILFTSGTEGDPKGVVLSHQNIIANIEQVLAHIELDPATDICFNPLPTFHCFGLTVGALLPVLSGIKAVFHPSPLQPREIARRVRETQATILLATDTFISQYARVGEQGDLNSVRLAVCGAERVKDETRQFVRRKFAIEILEGYGATEAAPVVAANQLAANKHGSVGQLMADMEYRLEPVEGIKDAGRLFIRGPNVMLGYLTPKEPGKLIPLPGGWHDTGDVVSIDEEGFITIRGRVKRFAKVGGEMVSLAVVENCASALWPDNMHAAVSIPDERKGEQIVLITDNQAAKRPALLSWVQNHGVSELSMPRKILHVEEVPVLGTGKIDYAGVQKLVDQQLAKPA
jgi:acyl-[acyl-carrier-protein]-phospholipid O-acyltransferase/long-chain-fatty-acid--[acyl-carrier-protein] ligase